ncbi:MAG: DinB family protein, partial [Planctomycetota bacterium]
MSIDLSRVVRAMRSHLEAFSALFAGVTPEEAQWRPEEGVWSLIEILGHLGDEERFDFRTRLEYTWNRPDDDWPPIDPDGWAVEKDYANYDLQEAWADFEMERERSLRWLSSLDDPDWEASRTHPIAGTIHAGDLVTAWEA